MANQIVCIGSMHWDIIGTSPISIDTGDDVPGTIVRRPGGVALNVARGLRRGGFDVVMLAAVGQDAAGDELLRFAEEQGIDVGIVHRSRSRPTDRYVAIEDANGLVAAIAHLDNLDESSEEMIAQLEGRQFAKLTGSGTTTIVIDGNLPRQTIERILASAVLRNRDLRVLAASQEKVRHTEAALSRANATLYLNRNEAERLFDTWFPDAVSAATFLASTAKARIVVTDGRNGAAMTDDATVLTSQPNRIVTGHGVTGAGDALAAAHIAAEMNGSLPQPALDHAVNVAEQFIAQNANGVADDRA